MSFVGKLVIVFQVAFSFVFMAFAGAVYTAQVNWKNKADSLQEQMQTTQNTMNQQTSEWEADRSDLQNQLAALDLRAKTAEQLVQDREAELNGLKADYDQVKTSQNVFEAEAGLSKEKGREKDLDDLFKKAKDKLRKREEDRPEL